jgi:hypothetical protein
VSGSRAVLPGICDFLMWRPECHAGKKVVDLLIQFALENCKQDEERRFATLHTKYASRSLMNGWKTTGTCCARASHAS